MAVGTVVLFGTTSMFLYPLLYKAGLLGDLTETQYGIFAGGSIYEVAQACVAGSGVSAKAEEIAVTVKNYSCNDACYYVDYTVYMGISKAVKTSATGSKVEKESIMKIIPCFAVGFILVSGFNSLELLPHTTVDAITTVDQFLLAMAMTALGLETFLSKFMQAGIKQLLLALVLFAWLFFDDLAITHLITAII